MDQGENQTRSSPTAEPWREKASDRYNCVDFYAAWSKCHLSLLLFAPEEQFAVHLKAEAHCLRPQGFARRAATSRV
jgi:hypothetical protein